MARPRKEGLEYFPHDVDAAADEKIAQLEALFANDGYATYFKLLERIYRQPSFELLLDEDMTKILAKRCRVSLARFQKILVASLKYKLFSQSEYESRAVLTSPSIKKRAGVVQEKREEMQAKYLRSKAKNLVSEAEMGGETIESKANKRIAEHRIGKQIEREREVALQLKCEREHHGEAVYQYYLTQYTRHCERKNLQGNDEDFLNSFIRWRQEDENKKTGIYALHR